ncbi:antitoxin [Candidatus Pacearchaeota archaeon CG10_big_fil_rev_8_21_14_0_10_32_14]|nr:MAG: antitoxin [Candidatus Pacearchaeota archaeon CG10_big_fil_rev_8_21_14_0_10_32_14]
MERITFNHEILAGKPIIKGTRISVEFILEMLASGMNIEEILKEYPHLKKEDILAALQYASRILEKEEIYNLH